MFTASFHLNSLSRLCARLARCFSIGGKCALLGIESSCDDTCAAVVLEDGSIVQSSQMSQHQQNQQQGGVIPSVAAKLHRENLPIVVSNVTTHVDPNKLDGVALTIGPGLAPCLGAGLEFAVQWCKEHHKPLILVDHMEAHAMTATMDHTVFYPAFGFMVSGGNTEIVYCPDHCHPFLKVGDTVDDACGECIDKVVRMIHQLSPTLFPPKHGGSQLSEWSAKYKRTKEYAEGGRKISFPLPMTRQHNANFSFSGIKTHSIRLLEKMKKNDQWSEEAILRFSYYFEQALIKHLIHKLSFALDHFPEVQSIVLSNESC